MIVCDGVEIQPAHLPASVRAGAVPVAAAVPGGYGRLPTLVELELMHIRRALEASHGHRGNAAAHSGDQ